MSKLVNQINIQLSPNTLNQGEKAILQEIASQLYAQNIFNFAQARCLANLSVWEFQEFLAKQKIQRHYTKTEFFEDIESIKTDIWK